MTNVKYSICAKEKNQFGYRSVTVGVRIPEADPVAELIFSLAISLFPAKSD